ncbi:SRPBCC family protein [Gemmobacter denitrificans]|uniref:SRPBCC family protein n=1 Tax=Gemmobacter denitrificans TaxID=3123040 RepID=A0ABU8BTP3_9RHOB
MKLSSREDLEAPIDFVYRSFADTENWERAAMRRGADVLRTDRLTSFGPGMGWTVGFVWRGKPRKVAIALKRVDPQHVLAFAASGSSFDAEIDVEFVELSARRTRVTVRSEIKARSLAARVFLQSMKLARGKIERKYEARVGQLCNEVEERYRTTARR